MASWDNNAGPAAPQPGSFSGPIVDFSALARLNEDYFKGTQQARERDLQRPITDTSPQAIQAEVLKRGGAPYAQALLPFLIQQQGGVDNADAIAEAQRLAGLPAAAGQQPAAARPQFSQPPAVMTPPRAPISAPAPVQQPQGVTAFAPAAVPGAEPGEFTTAQNIVSDFYGDNERGQKVLANVVKAFKIADPSAPLTPDVRNKIEKALSGSQSVSLEQGQPAVPKSYVGMLRDPGQANEIDAGADAAPTATPSRVAASPAPTAAPAPQPAQQLPPGVSPEVAERYQQAAAHLTRRAAAVGKSDPQGALALTKQAEFYNDRAKQIYDTLSKYGEPTPDMKNATASGAPTPLAFEERKTQGTEINKAIGADISEYIKAARPAQMKIQSLDTIADALKRGDGNITTGPFAELALKSKEALSSVFNINLAGTAEAEVAQKMGFQLATQAVKEITARPSQMEFKVAMQNNPGLLLSPKGSLLMVDVMKQASRQQIELAKLAQQPKNWPDWQGVVDDYYQKHPLVSPFTKKPLGSEDLKLITADAGPAAAGAASTAPAAPPAPGNYVFDPATKKLAPRQ